MNVVIRDASVDDAPALMDMHTRARTSYYRGYVPDDVLAEENRRRQPEDYTRAIRSPHRIVRCAERNNTVIGFSIIGDCHDPDPDPAVGGELLQLYVLPAWFRRGVGTALHEAAVTVWRERQVTAARLWVWEFNHRGRAFYGKQGWLADGHHRPDDPRIDAYRMLGLRLSLSGE